MIKTHTDDLKGILQAIKDAESLLSTIESLDLDEIAETVQEIIDELEYRKTIYKTITDEHDFESDLYFDINDENPEAEEYSSDSCLLDDLDDSEYESSFDDN